MNYKCNAAARKQLDLTNIFRIVEYIFYFLRTLLGRPTLESFILRNWKLFDKFFMIKPFKPANLNQYSSAKSFYLGVKINPTVPVSNSFCEFLKTRSERKKCLIKWLLLSQKHEKGFIWPTPSDSVYTGLDTFFYLFFSRPKIEKWKNWDENSSTKTCTLFFAVQKLARFRESHCTKQGILGCTWM